MDRNKEPDWLQMISHGSLFYPNENLWEMTQKLEVEFYQMHGNSLSKEEKIFELLSRRTIAQIASNTIPYEVVLCLSRTRTYIRL